MLSSIFLNVLWQENFILLYTFFFFGKLLLLNQSQAYAILYFRLDLVHNDTSYWHYMLRLLFYIFHVHSDDLCPKHFFVVVVYLLYPVTYNLFPLRFMFSCIFISHDVKTLRNLTQQNVMPQMLAFQLYDTNIKNTNNLLCCCCCYCCWQATTTGTASHC